MHSRQSCMMIGVHSVGNNKKTLWSYRSIYIYCITHTILNITILHYYSYPALQITIFTYILSMGVICDPQAITGLLVDCMLPRGNKRIDSGLITVASLFRLKNLLFPMADILFTTKQLSFYIPCNLMHHELYTHNLHSLRK